MPTHRTDDIATKATQLASNEASLLFNDYTELDKWYEAYDNAYQRILLELAEAEASKNL